MRRTASRRPRHESAFVTGGATGIGRACALALAAEGCFVTVAGRTESTLNDTVRSIAEAGGSAQAVTCDVTIESMVQSAVAAAAGHEDRLDVAVNSAGYDCSAAMPTSEWRGEMLDEMLTSSARGTFLPMKYELEVTHRQGSGAIVNIGSGAGLLGVPGHSGYVSTLMAAGPVPEVAAYSGHSVGELAAVAAGDTRLRSQTTLAVYTHATGQAREMALAAVGAYLDRLLAAAPRLRPGLAS